MYHADRVGTANVLAALRRFHGDDGWAPAALLVRLAEQGRTFEEGDGS
jgi:hypothetical protein